MKLRYSYKARPLITILAAVIAVVALACGGDAATPTSPPTATSRPTATAPSSGVPTATSPANMEATATAVPDVDVDYRDDWINYLKGHRGYKAEWGEPQYGGIIKTADPRTATRFQLTVGYSAFSRWQFASHNSLL
ncbi:MAG: hypothetical protein O2783_06435, partial [Chloroflexi bacterium]|nr:hypothetical protein [Chloroflexota bacterium]